MSMDFYLYLKQTMPDKFKFERYAMEQGFQIKVHPEIDLMTNAGFCPICLTDERFADEPGANAFLTGFELDHDKFTPIKPTTTVSKGFFGLFRKKQPKATPFDIAIKDSSIVLAVSCSTVDSFEALMAYIFGSYCVKYCNAIFDDPQLGCFYNNAKEIEIEIERITEELCEEKEAGKLQIHRFEKWL